MPTYEYACGSCAHEWEFEQSIKDAPLTECPQCHQATAKRQISRGTGFILKGSGWYSDLYASSTNKPPKAESASEGKGSDGKPSGDAGSSSGGASGSGGTSSGGASGTGSSPSGGSSSASAAA